jgi:hypothetical protein
MYTFYNDKVRLNINRILYFFLTDTISVHSYLYRYKEDIVMSNLDQHRIGLIHEGHFYEVLINKEPTIFKEDLYPQVARLPMELNWPKEDEKKLVVVSYNSTGEGHQPFISKRSNQLPEDGVKMLLEQRIESSNCFSPSPVGGSVNLPQDTE